MTRPAPRPDPRPDARPARWPVALWLLQASIPGALLAYAAARIASGLPLGWIMTPAAALAALWFAATVGVAARPRGRAWIRAKRLHLLLAATSALLSAAILDLGLTVFGIVPTIGAIRARSPDYAKSVFTRLVPKVVAPDPAAGRDVPIRVQRLGVQGPDPLEDPDPDPDADSDSAPRPARILFLGGSHVFDLNGLDWPGRAGARLNAGDPARPVRVFNAGTPAHTTVDGVVRLLTELRHVRPDWVVVCYGWNDIRYFAELGPERTYAAIVTPPRPTLRDWRVEPVGLDRLLCLSAFYRVGRNAFQEWSLGPEGRALKPPVGSVRPDGPEQYRLGLQTLCDLARNLGARPILVRQARLPVPDSPPEDRARIQYGIPGLPHDELVAAYARCDAILDEVARTKGVPLIDLHASLSGRAELFTDHVHFTPEGSEQAARRFAEAFQPLLEASDSAPDRNSDATPTP